MTDLKRLLDGRVTVTELGEFLDNPPTGFSVEAIKSGGYRVHSDPEQSLVLMEPQLSCTGTIDFPQTLGRVIKMHNLFEYSSMRKSLLSKRIYLLVSACEENSTDSNKNTLRVLQQYVVSVDGNDPIIRWQMERGLDWTISSVAGESYSVNIDFTEYMESLGVIKLCANGEEKVKPVWMDAFFTLKYQSDALFDFPYWFGFSKRTFNFCQNSCG